MANLSLLYSLAPAFLFRQIFMIDFYLALGARSPPRFSLLVFSLPFTGIQFPVCSFWASSLSGFWHFCCCVFRGVFSPQQVCQSSLWLVGSSLHASMLLHTHTNLLPLLLHSRVSATVVIMSISLPSTILSTYQQQKTVGVLCPKRLQDVTNECGDHFCYCCWHFATCLCKMQSIPCYCLYRI